MDLIGGEFGLSPLAVAAFGGEVATQISDLEDPAHAGERAHGRLIEVYVRRRRDWEEAQAVSPPGPELGESEARMADRLHTLAEANRIQVEVDKD